MVGKGVTGGKGVGLAGVADGMQDVISNKTVEVNARVRFMMHLIANNAPSDWGFHARCCGGSSKKRILRPPCPIRSRLFYNKKAHFMKDLYKTPEKAQICLRDFFTFLH